MTTWARSPQYGTSVVLGPTQEAVYSHVTALTEDGRRPYVTLARVAGDVGKPVSSVHAALGRLRALGLIGVSAHMGRTGGHRLWRVASRRMGAALDVARHKRAIGRIVKRWTSADTVVRSQSTEGPPVSVPPAGRRHTPNGVPVGGNFREAMRRAGFRAWWRLDDDDGATSDDGGRATDGDNRGADTLGLVVVSHTPL